MSYFVIGSKLSPFTLKVEALLNFAGVDYINLPAETGFITALRGQLKMQLTRKDILKPANPNFDQDDDLPLVPYLYQPTKPLHYDSSHIAALLNEHYPLSIYPKEPALQFVNLLLEDFADEIALYVVHHHRWVTSKSTNNAGQRLGKEWKTLLGPFNPLLGKWFARRQIKRLPYLFSVDNNVAGFPSTHELIEELSNHWLQALEAVLSQQPYIFGNRISLTDFAHYGQLSMNLDDPCAANLMKTTAPNTFTWASNIREGKITSKSDFAFNTALLAPLIELLNRYYFPIMKQNFSAYSKYKAAGEKQFNESAFNQRQCLYEGEVNGMRFRSVAKSFQAKVWKNNINQWRKLSAEQQQIVRNWGVNTEYLD